MSRMSKRPQHWPNRRAVTLLTIPRMKVIRDEKKIESDLLCSYPVGDQARRIVLFSS